VSVEAGIFGLTENGGNAGYGCGFSSPSYLRKYSEYINFLKLYSGLLLSETNYIKK